LRSVVVAGVGGLIVGHILWLLAISLAVNTPSVPFWVLIVAAGVAVYAAVTITLGVRHYRRKSFGWAAFLLGLAVSPVLFTLIVLGVTYL
jgi:hypothetical protein